MDSSRAVATVAYLAAKWVCLTVLMRAHLKAAAMADMKAV
jgi:hypothetical protein